MTWKEDIDDVDVAKLTVDDHAYKTFVISTFKEIRAQNRLFEKSQTEIFDRLNHLQTSVAERIGQAVEREKVIVDLKEIARENTEHITRIATQLEERDNTICYLKETQGECNDSILRLTASVENGLRDKQKEMATILEELKKEIQKLTTQGIVRATKEAESLTGSINEGWKWTRERLGRVIVLSSIVFMFWAIGKEIFFQEKGLLFKIFIVIKEAVLK